MTKNGKIVISALISAGGFWVLVGLLDRAGLDMDKWVRFAIWTAFVFGCIIYLYAESLDENWHCKVAFFVALTLHSLVLIMYLRSVDRFPNVSFPLLFFFFTVEGGIIAGTLGILGAVSYRARRPKKSLGRTPPSGTSPTRGSTTTPGTPKGA